MNKFFKNVKRGFTLVELLIVIIIIAVLAGIVLVTLDPAAQRARAGATTMKANVAAVCRAQALCLVESATGGPGCDEYSEIGIPDPSGNPTGSAYTIDTTGTPWLITGIWTQSSTEFTMTCNNINASKGEVTCVEDNTAGGIYTCAGFGL
jgi:prepilin-type N-terminal cleavage/methylation domain-containing protein